MNGVVTHGPRSLRQVALTFDDAPGSPWTQQILDVLEGTGTRATFYAIGARVDRDPVTSLRMLRVGGEVGTHAYGERHLDLRQLRPPEVAYSLRLTHDAIIRATSEPPVTFRPPFGLYNAQVLAIECAAAGHPPAEREPGGTVQALPVLIETLRLRGHELVTVRKLLRR